MESKLREIYYAPEHYFRGKSAAKKLAELSGYSEDKCQEWLNKQIIYQIYYPKPRRIIRAKFDVSVPNTIHQADLLFLPHDTVKRKTYKYALTVIDVASRYKAAWPLTSKNSDEVASAFNKIYSGLPGPSNLKWPKAICVDAGREFMGDVTRLMTKHNVSVSRADAGNHRAQALVERFNRTLAEKLFTVQYAQEILKEARQEKDVRSREWVNNLQVVVKELNNTKTRLIKMTPEEAIKKDNVESVTVIDKNEQVIDLGPHEKVRYLLEPGEIEGDTRRRATDPIWSLQMYDIEDVTQGLTPARSSEDRTNGLSPSQPYLYKLRNIRRRFVKDELLIVPAQSELPPDKIL
jgi:transposase InsO family protein